VSGKQAIYLSILGVKNRVLRVSGMLFFSLFHFQSSWLLKLAFRLPKTGRQESRGQAVM